jgi:hypothetical protein
VEVEESIRINRSVHIILDFDESLPQETISAATVIIIVITAALMQNGVRIDKVEIEGVDADRMKVSFHGKPGNFIREYFFETAMLMKAIQKAGRSTKKICKTSCCVNSKTFLLICKTQPKATFAL